ncbi:MAG: hypothetical protein U7123_18475 [Potamolinea sp.]
MSLTVRGNVELALNSLEMPVIRIFLLLLVVGSLALFALNNWSPVLAVQFLGMNFPTLPLAAWIGCAIATGAITSFLLQFLSSISSGYSRKRFAEPDEEEEERPQTRQGSWQNRENQPPPINNSSQTAYTPPPPPRETPKNKSASDWEETVDENWDLGQESAATRSNSVSERASYETQQQPQSRSQSGSVYSWSYREAKDSGVGKTDAVYDANYRVITPPSQPTTKPEEEEDDEDWGFEDDEDFKDEGDSKKKR